MVIHRSVVPIILGRPFLRTAKALVDLYEEKLILRVRKEEVVFYTDKSSRNNSRDIQSVHCINIIDFSKEKPISGSTTSHSNLSLPSYESFCFDNEEKSSGSTIFHYNHSLPEYESFCFDVDHIEEKSSGSTTSHFDLSLLEYDSFHFDLSIDPLPPADRSDSQHEEFADELTHIISPPEYDHFYFDLEADHELNDFSLLLSDLEKFNFLADFIIVDFEADPRVPIILGRPFLRTAKALVDLYEEKLILRVGKEEVVFYTDKSSRNNSRDIESVHCINIIDFSKEKPISGSTTSHSNLSLPSYESFCFDNEEKSSGSTTFHSNHSLPEYESFCFDFDHIEEKSSGSTTSHSDLSLLEDDSFYFDLSIRPLPPVDRKADPGELTIILKKNISETLTKDLKIHELNDFSLLLSDCDSIFSKEIFEINFLVLFPFGNKDKVFDPGIFTINGVHSKRFSILHLDDFSSIQFVRDFLSLTDPSEIETFLSFPSGNEDKVFDPRILISDGVFSFKRKASLLLIDNFMIDKCHLLRFPMIVKTYVLVFDPLITRSSILFMFISRKIFYPDYIYIYMMLHMSELPHSPTQVLSFHFDILTDPLPPADRSDSQHEEFADELAHIISPPEYDHFYFYLEADPGELTRILKKNISDTLTKDLKIHELDDFSLLLSDCDSIFSEEFSYIDFLVLFTSGNKDKVFDPGIFTINGIHSKRFSILLLDDFSKILFVRDFLSLTGPSEINTFLSFSSENEDKVFNPGILISDGVFSFTRKAPLLLIDNFMIDKCHILSEISLMTESSVSFLPKDKEIRGEIPYDREDHRACFQSSNHSVFDHLHVQRIENEAETLLASGVHAQKLIQESKLYVPLSRTNFVSANLVTTRGTAIKISCRSDKKIGSKVRPVLGSPSQRLILLEGHVAEL
ncbi:reverse transcriptase domain-containing protein [Tanacetum coccineum]